MQFIHGATPKAWHHFSVVLGLCADLLPVVSNPDAVISPNSQMKALGKTPSDYNQDRQAKGLYKWTQSRSTPADVDRWAQEPDYGISLQTRLVRAFDIDVGDTARSDAIRDAIFETLGLALPIRWRSDSGKQLLAFHFQYPLTKHVLDVDGGMVEVLADGQQFIAIGRHPAGELYKWGGDASRRGLPHIIPDITPEQFEAVKSMLADKFGKKEWRVAREKREGAGVDLQVHDEVADWLAQNWECFDVGSDQQLFIRCPFEGEHTSDSGPSSTAYFPAGTGGYRQGHFVCLHAHCAGREDRDYLDATGFSVDQFDDLSGSGNTGVVPVVGNGAFRLDASSGSGSGGRLDRELGRSGDAECGQTERASVDDPSGNSEAERLAAAEALDWGTYERNKDGKLTASARGLVDALTKPGMVKMHLAYDTFNDALMCRPLLDQGGGWRRFGDPDMIAIRIELEKRGFAPMGKELLRDAIATVANRNVMDTAQRWLNGLSWDGCLRVDRFAVDIWGWEDTPYAVAVSRYVWSALAGRIMQPGVRADMAPILIGLQGARKTTLLQMMAPDEEMYTEVRLDDKDDNTSRKLRGKLIGELEELRGLNSRALEEIKAFITRRKEAWVPKFKEFENYFWRRNLFFGTTNEDEMLGDPTGERRWLPGRCGRIDVERLVADRDQYWAEGAMLFAFEGVIWQDAERLARAEHAKFKVSDSWTARIRSWLSHDDIAGVGPLDKGFVTVDEALGAIGIMPAYSNRGHEKRVERVLLGVGFKRVGSGDDVRYER